MDISTYIQKVSDAIYDHCEKKRKYKVIKNNVETSVDNENLSPVPYYYINVLNVITDMGIEECHDDTYLTIKLKKYSRELTLFRLHHIVSDMFHRHFEDEEIVDDFTKGFEDEFKNNFKYMDLVTQTTPGIVSTIRQFTGEFVENIDSFDFRSFDKELTENLYDCIDCEDFDDDDEDYEEESEDDDDDEDDEEESEESEDDDDDEEESEDNDEVHELLDKKIEEIRELKERIKGLETHLESLRSINDKYAQILTVNEQRTDHACNMMRFGVIVAFVLMFSPYILRNTKVTIDQHLN